MITEEEKSILDKLKKFLQLQEWSQAESLFKQTRLLLTQVATLNDEDLTTAQIGLLGIISRTNELLLGSLEQTISGNRHLWAMTVRGLIETFGVVCWLSDVPTRVTNILQQNAVSVGRTNNFGFNKVEGSKELYNKLSKIAHPNVPSLLTGTTPYDEEQHLAFIAVPSPKPSSEEVAGKCKLIIGIVGSIYSELEQFISGNKGTLIQSKPVGKSFRASNIVNIANRQSGDSN